MGAGLYMNEAIIISVRVVAYVVPNNGMNLEYENCFWWSGTFHLNEGLEIHWLVKFILKVGCTMQ